MSWRPDHPVELPDGRLVCRPHGLVICGYCTVDYSFMDDLLKDNDDDDDDDDIEPSDSSDFSDDDIAHYEEDVPVRFTDCRIGTGSIFPTMFIPPDPLPLRSHFSHSPEP